MIRLFVLMLSGYALGVIGTVLAPTNAAVRRLCGTGAVVGAAGGAALALSVFATRTPFALDVPALLSVADGLAFRLDPLGAVFLFLVGLVASRCAQFDRHVARRSRTADSASDFAKSTRTSPDACARAVGLQIQTRAGAHVEALRRDRVDV